MTFPLLEWAFLPVNNISILIDEIPQIINSKILKVLKEKVIKLQVVLTGRFKKYHLSTNDIEFTEIVVASKNSIIHTESEVDNMVYDREIENLKINFSVFSKYFENNQR